MCPSYERSQEIQLLRFGGQAISAWLCTFLFRLFVQFGLYHHPVWVAPT